jgi:hypothetical protein
MPEDQAIPPPHLTDPSNAPSAPPARTPLGLDYFAAHAPERRASRAANWALAAVVVSLIPFLCGVLNVAVVAHSHSQRVTAAHRGGATLFLAAGVLVCAVGLGRLVVLRHWFGVILAGVVLIGQLAVVACTGAAAL